MLRLFTALTYLFCFSIMFSQTFQQIEAAEYDPTQDRWLVSNASSIIAQDNLGELSYFGNASASHGMEVMNDILFAISGSTLKGYSLADGSELMSESISGAGFLNGMASDPASSKLWMSDFGNGRILEVDVTDISDPQVTTLISNTGSTPNGVVHDAENNRIVFVNWGGNAAIKQVDLSSGNMTTITSSGLGNCDGIDIDGQGNFYVSSWSPTRITRFNNDFSQSEIMTAPGISNPADISYGIEINTLGIANSGNETLTLLTFTPSTISEFEDKSALQLFPNPVSSVSRIEFELPNTGPVDLTIYDAQGREVSSLLTGQQPQGLHQVLLHGVELTNGHYFLSLTSKSQQVVRSFVVQGH